jgi:teichuronic acid biosynthesis glycosyltransferase TuaC
MKVLFVAKEGSDNFSIPPFVKAQGESLKECGVEIHYFMVTGRGVKGYISSSRKLRAYLDGKGFDLIHAHFSLCGWTAVLARSRCRIVLSLMGSDAYGIYVGKGKRTIKGFLYPVLTLLIQPFVASIICKAPNIEKFVWLKRRSQIIPNGIDLSCFVDEGPEHKVREQLGFSSQDKIVLFMGDPSNPRKNYPLAQEACTCLKDSNIKLIAPYPISHDAVIKYMNAANVLVFPSFMEGSPNVVKEAMACNCPIVATKVGDIEWLLGDEAGHYLSDFSPEDFSCKLKEALEFSTTQGKTHGRERLLTLGLDSRSVAQRIKDIYTCLIT